MKRRFKIYCSLFWFLFSVIACHQASRLKIGEFSQPGPGFFPLSIGIVMGILSIIALIISFLKREKKGLSITTEKIRWWNIAIILVLIIGYALSLEKIGFLINTFLLITILLKVVEPQSWKTSISGGLITAILSDLVFNFFLRAQIPRGIFGF